MGGGGGAGCWGGGVDVNEELKVSGKLKKTTWGGGQDGCERRIEN